jgi:hypothetical protein
MRQESLSVLRARRAAGEPAGAGPFIAGLPAELKIRLRFLGSTQNRRSFPAAVKRQDTSRPA